MKTIIISAITTFALALPISALSAAEVKEVCRDKTDKAGKVVMDKKGKPVQECKKIKVHKKLEGTKIEDAKKK